MVEGQRELPEVSFIRALIPFTSAPCSRSNHPSRPHLGDVVSTYEFWRDTNIQSVAILLSKVLSFVECRSVPGSGWSHGDGTHRFSLFKPLLAECPQVQEHLVILLAQGRGLSAARPLEVEVEGSATASPEQPDPPRNTEDHCDPAAKGHAPTTCSPPCLFQTHPKGSTGA